MKTKSSTLTPRMLSDFCEKRLAPVIPEEVAKRLHQYMGELLAREEYPPYRGAGLDLTALVVAWSSSPRGGRTGEPKMLQIEIFDKEIHDAAEAILTDPVVQPIREEHRLPAINALDETRHARLRLTCRSLPQRAVSTQPWPKVDIRTISGAAAKRFREQTLLFRAETPRLNVSRRKWLELKASAS